MRTNPLIRFPSVAGLAFLFIASAQGEEVQPLCGGTSNLKSGIECIRTNEPMFRSASQGKQERSLMRESAFRLINPELEIEHAEGRFLGDVKRDTSANLLFSFELGGKRSARSRVLDADGMELQAAAYEQRVNALVDFGGSLLRLHQLEVEREIIQESSSTFQKVIRLFRSRQQLPPEQQVSLHAFELVVLEYERKLLEAQSEKSRLVRKVKPLFGELSVGFPVLADTVANQVSEWRVNLDSWILETPEMLKIRAKQMRADGNSELARAEAWPDLRVGPSISQVTDGPFSYQTYGIRLSFPIPILSVNSSMKQSTALTKTRVVSSAYREETDVRALYESKLNELEKITLLLKEAPNEKDIGKKHASTERLFERGLVSGALMIEAHRTLVEHYENRHALERELLEWSLKFDLLRSDTL